MTTQHRAQPKDTDAHIDAAIEAARKRELVATKIVGAHYDAEHDAVVTDLSTGSTLIVPRHAIPGFAKAEPVALADISINPGAESLWSDTVDDGVLLDQLLEIAAGSEHIKTLGGRISGRSRTPAKAAAARANGAKGGRPSKKTAPKKRRRAA